MQTGRINIEILDDWPIAFVRLPGIAAFEASNIYCELSEICNLELEGLKEKLNENR